MPHSFDFHIKPRQVLLFIRRRSKNIFISNLWSQPLYSRISTRLHFWKQDSSSRFCHMIFILPSFPLSFLSLPRPSALFVVLLRWSGRRFRVPCCSLSPLQFSLRFAWTLSHTDNRPDLWTDDRRRETDRWSICCCQLDNIIPILLISTNLTMPLFSSSFCSHAPSPITDDPQRNVLPFTCLQGQSHLSSDRAVCLAFTINTDKQKDRSYFIQIEDSTSFKYAKATQIPEIFYSVERLSKSIAKLSMCSIFSFNISPHSTPLKGNCAIRRATFT